MLAKVLSAAVIGIDGYVVDVEVDISQGLPSFSTVGLAEGAVRESKERVKAAMTRIGPRTPLSPPDAMRWLSDFCRQSPQHGPCVV